MTLAGDARTTPGLPGRVARGTAEKKLARRSNDRAIVATIGIDALPMKITDDAVVYG